jgi:hypothetical protein
MLNWFRGGEANLTQFENRVSANVQIDIQRKITNVQTEKVPSPALNRK